MRKWEGWFAWRCINQAMRSEMVSSLVFGEKIRINWHVKRGFVSIKSREGKPRLSFLTPVLQVLTYLSCLGLGLALPNFATHFCQACLKFSKWEGGTLAHGYRGRTAPSHGRSCTPQTQPRERTLTDTCCRMWTNQTQPSYRWHIIFVHRVCLSNRMLGSIRTARAVVCWGRRRGEEEGLGEIGYSSNRLKW